MFIYSREILYIIIFTEEITALTNVRVRAPLHPDSCEFWFVYQGVKYSSLLDIHYLFTFQQETDDSLILTW